MNAATGPQKVDAIAELLTLLVQRQQALHAMHESMMGHMSMMMNKMHNSAGTGSHKERGSGAPARVKRPVRA
jgi:hypothetical protein